MTVELPTLVIGDVHGHVDRLRALLTHEGIIDAAGNRIRYDVRVVQLGDLGHFGWTGDAADDLECWRQAPEWLDVVLWGNHDRAVVDSLHTFGGFVPPASETRRAIDSMMNRGRVLLATAAHGHLLTHAGLHPTFDDETPERLDKAVDYLNAGEDLLVVNAISPERGGRHPVGGILWRDYDEPLSERWPQVFGHSRADTVRRVGMSWCIDIGGRANGRLAGLWLPGPHLVEVRGATGVIRTSSTAWDQPEPTATPGGNA